MILSGRRRDRRSRPGPAGDLPWWHRSTAAGAGFAAPSTRMRTATRSDIGATSPRRVSIEVGVVRQSPETGAVGTHQVNLEGVEEPPALGRVGRGAGFGAVLKYDPVSSVIPPSVVAHSVAGRQRG